MASSKPITDIDNLTARDLLDDDQLQRCYLEFVRRGFWPNSMQSALEFFTFAEKALADDKHGTPGKLFYALIKRKDASFLTDEHERRAIRRFSTSDRHLLVDKADGLKVLKKKQPTREEVSDQLFGRNIGYHHGVMVQCFLPQTHYTGHRWQTDHGKASLVVHAGEIADPDTPNRFEQRFVPSGSKARLILPYIVGYAVTHKTQEIDMGNSLRRFLKSIGLNYGGKQGRAVTQQVENIAAASIMLGVWSDEVVRNPRVPIADEISFWLERDGDQGTLWTPSMTISPQFFGAIQKHRVPIDMDHMVKLARSPRRQDLYVWLSYRLPMLKRPLNMPFATMQQVFGQGITDPYKFRQSLKRDLVAIHDAYAGFNVEIKKDYVQLKSSPSPVPTNVHRLIA